ncbi:MAG: PHP domain-containing protein [Clostridiales bacterium]|nr:PHP domain-containing protein [Clostridiales bacterium]
MYVHDPIYDIDELARQNLHIHTNFSACAKEEMTLSAILREAEKADLEIIAITDHFTNETTDKQCVERYEQLRMQYREEKSPVMVLFGSEFSLCGVGKTLENEKTRLRMDYRLYAPNHYHVNYWEHPEDKSPRGYALHGLEMISTLIKTNKEVDCIAHPFTGRYINAIEEKNAVAASLTDNELGDLLTLARDNGVAIELNCFSVNSDPVFTRRMWYMGKELGVCFNFGMDAHWLSVVDTKPLAELMKAIVS